MENIKTIIKHTLAALSKKEVLATPSNYEKEFFKILKESNVQIDDSIAFDSLVSSLTADEKFLLKENNIVTFSDLAYLLLERITNDDLLKFVDNIDFMLTPSIDYSVEEQIKELKNDLISNPHKLTRNSTISRIKKFTTERISRDKMVVQEKAKDVKKVINLMGRYFDKCLLQSSDASNEIVMIKDEIEGLDLSLHSSRDLSMLQSKLVDTIHKLENSIVETEAELFKGQTDCIYLQKQVTKLQKDLDEVSKEKDFDFLTGIFNRRAFSVEVDKIENEYEIFKSKYALVFYDIDHFKSINDNYGHDCGDSIIVTFATILKKLTREEDVVCRYGGEEFVSLIHYTNEEEVLNYLKRVKNIISSNKFVYKDIKLKVKFSAGVIYRNKYPTYEDAMTQADLLLNKAKHEGRNKIIIDNGSYV